MQPRSRIQAAATTGNFGPAFDTLSLALAGLGDEITLEAADADGITVTGPGAAGVPTAWNQNVVGPTLDALRARTGTEARFHVTLHKPRPGGSGLGSSAASAGGAALAFHAMHPDAGLAAVDLWRAAVAGEAQAGGNPEDVAAVILGGLALVQPPEGLHRIEPPTDLVLALLVPELECPTAEMRALLPAAWPRDDVIANLGHTAALVHAFHRGDVAAIGVCLDDRLALPYRKVRLPHYDDAHRAAVAAGAHGACVSGSGPTILAVCDDAAVAADVAAAMRDACAELAIPAQGLVAHPETEVPHATALH